MISFNETSWLLANFQTLKCFLLHAHGVLKVFNPNLSSHSPPLILMLSELQPMFPQSQNRKYTSFFINLNCRVQFRTDCLLAENQDLLFSFVWHAKIRLKTENTFIREGYRNWETEICFLIYIHHVAKLHFDIWV